MGRKMKKLTRAGAGALAGVMVFGLAVPLAPLSVEAADVTNLAIGATATASEFETNTPYTADKAIDGIVNREAPKPQSRWATNRSENGAAQWLKVDLGEKKTFQSFVLAWERRNITSYKIQISDTGEDNDESKWTTVYQKTGTGKISGINENIRLDEAKEARYVRLYIDGYEANGADDETNWRSISLYDFQIYADAIPETLLPDENYCLEGTAEASDAETENPAANVIDGDLETRWATNNDGKGTTARTLTVKLPATQRVQYLKINWENTANGLNVKKYTIDVKDSETGQFKNVYTKNEQVTKQEEIIELESPVWAKEIRLNVTEYGAATGEWYNVSAAEFGAYALKPDSSGISEDSTAQQIADRLAAPTLNEDNTKLTWETPEGATVEFLADYEQIVGRDGKIYQPLRDTQIKGIYKVTKNAAAAETAEGASEQETAEGKVEHTITIPGKYTTDGANAKPTVVPELAEWYGGETAGDVTISGKILVDSNAAELKSAADALAADYEAELGKKMTVETGNNPGAGDIYFTLDKGDNGLGEEGYLMESNEHVKITAAHQTGAYWATRSILQIAELNEGKLPKGTAKDYPKYEVRGFMLDVARKPVSMETLNDVAKEMAYYKMNALQVHLNDNLIFYEDYASAEEAREKAYTGFRLESDIVEGSNEGKNKADLTTKDMHYTKEEFRKFILDSRAMGVDIIPEFDTPGHSGAFTKVRPDLMLQNVLSGEANRAGEQFDLSEAKYDESLGFVQSVWDEYLKEDMFDKSMTVHIGTDEYYGEKNRFRIFSDDMIKYIQEKGYTVRMWGSLSNMLENQPGAHPVRSEGVQLNIWNTGYANPKDMYEKGYELINTLESNYIVPAAGYYNDYLNANNLYTNWVPNKFGNIVTLPAGSDQMLGATYAIWNDSIDTKANGISEIDIYDRFASALPAIASKDWGDGADKNWADVKTTVDELGDAANSNPYHEASADESGKYMEYQFANKEDSSENKRNLELAGEAKIEDGSLKLAGGESYATTPINKLATGNTLEFDITLDKTAKAGQILFETDNLGDNDDYVHDIRIMEDGRLGFRRELYDYYFDYKLPVGEKVHLAIRTEGTKTYLVVGGQELQATGVYRNRQTDGEVRKEGIAISTLLLPLQRIGSKTNSIEATIDNVVVSTTAPEKTTYDKSKWTGTATSAHANVGSEGTFEMAFDSNSETRWHSDYSGNQAEKPNKLLKDNLKKVEGKLDSVTGEITFDKGYELNKVSFTPRGDSASGIITKADLFVKNSKDGEWVQVAADQTFANNQAKKTVYFEPQTVWGIKIVAKQSNDGWVAVSEFDIGAPQSYNIVVEAQEGGNVEGTVKDVSEGTEVAVKATADEGYDFAGWYDMLTGQKVSDDAEYTFTVTANTSLIAHFAEEGQTPDPEPGTWKVTLNGTEVTVKDGEKLTRPATDPAKAGHKFLGWYNGEEAFDFDTPITEELNGAVIEAKFEQYKVTAETSEGGTTTVGEMNDKGEVTVTAKANEGYEFKGWKVDGGELQVLGTPYTFVPEKDTTIEAVYEKKDDTKTYYTVTIDGKEVTVEEGQKLTRPTDPSKPGRKFIGWFAGDKEFDFNTPITENGIVIEARFEEYKPIIEGDKGDVQVSEMNEKGEVTVTAKEKEGYTFQYWIINGEIMYGTQQTFVMEEGMKIEAVYEKKDDTKTYYTVTINGQNITVEEGQKLARPADPVREGYKFIGWFVGDKEFDFNTPITAELNGIKIEARFEKIKDVQKPDDGKGDTNNKGDKENGAVQTGDATSAAPLLASLVAMVGAGAATLKSRKKRSE